MPTSAANEEGKGCPLSLPRARGQRFIKMASKQSSKKCKIHSYADEQEIQDFRTCLLDWYGSQKRELPWRTMALTETDPNKRAYAVWVSEIMLQQTQVVTVIDYYTRWMSRWPTVEKLAEATLEEINHMWSGLGYYSRGRRLWDGAKKVVCEMNGVIPQTREQLLKCLPGVGQYTSGAIASIAYGQATGAVDGNVMRVFARHRCIGADIATQSTVQHFWDLANTVVDPLHPGNFNQALMELGAIVCTPKSPLCQSCPVRAFCGGFAKVQIVAGQTKLTSDSTTLDTKGEKQQWSSPVSDLAETANDCSLCLTEWNQEHGVMNYPQKTKKKKPSLQYYAVAIIEEEEQLLLRKRPDKGLLAGLWEFPSVELTDMENSEKSSWEKISTLFLNASTILSSTPIGEVVHQFSHTHHNYNCWYVRLKSTDKESSTLCFPLSESVGEAKWVRKEDIGQCAIPTATKKMLKLLTTEARALQTVFRKRFRHADSSPTNSKLINSKRQKKIDSYFKREVDHTKLS